jgi:hypothetical protein
MGLATFNGMNELPMKCQRIPSFVEVWYGAQSLSSVLTGPMATDVDVECQFAITVLVRFNWYR